MRANLAEILMSHSVANIHLSELLIEAPELPIHLPKLGHRPFQLLGGPIQVDELSFLNFEPPVHGHSVDRGDYEPFPDDEWYENGGAEWLIRFASYFSGIRSFAIDFSRASILFGLRENGSGHPGFHGLFFNVLCNQLILPNLEALRIAHSVCYEPALYGLLESHAQTIKHVDLVNIIFRNSDGDWRDFVYNVYDNLPNVTRLIMEHCSDSEGRYPVLEKNPGGVSAGGDDDSEEEDPGMGTSIDFRFHVPGGHTREDSGRLELYM
ncbi:hypothetical protein B0T16DRAFT_455576 [Cercophora newfieldiana]|uniref:Uncharacterized protein n=1 Tax=Cercophora newfieldiana TaxID=92897 RepID=A0AA39Y997_9PEZI|nr:hypothetical protein B0T16DRAFT_455576 [Cercophora newfieldiana]